MRLFSHCCFFALLSLAMFSCKEKGGKTHGPIVMGDPATIVTETDSQYLLDLVPDLELPSRSPADTAAALPADTATVPQAKPADTAATKPAQPAPPPASAGGLTINFGEVQVTLPNTAVTNPGGNYTGKQSAALTLSGSSYAPTQVGVSGGTVSRIQQRNTYAVTATQSGKPLLLRDLGTQSGAWQALKQGGGSYTAAPMEKPSFRVNGNAIRNAAQKAARAARMSKADEAALSKALRNANDVSTAPLAVVLKSVVWKIDGKDAKGKPFSKEVRIDVPL